MGTFELWCPMFWNKTAGCANEGATVRPKAPYLVIVCLVFLWATNSAYGQKPADVLDWIDSNAVAVGVVRDVGSFEKYILQMNIWPNKYWSHALELLRDKEFGRLNQEDIDEVQDWLKSFTNAIRDVEELAIVIHELQTDELKFSILLKASDTVREDFWNQLDGLGKLSTVQSAKDLTSKLVFKKRTFRDWLIVSNDEESLGEIIQKCNDSKTVFRSINDSRRFQTVTANFKDARQGHCVFQGFGVPSKLRAIIPRMNDTRWETLKIEELPSFGLQVFFMEPSTDRESNQPQPALVFDANILFTRPRVGLGKLALAYDPIDAIPELTGDEIEVSAIAFDPSKIFAAKKEMFESLDRDHPARKGQTYEDLVNSMKEPFDERSLEHDVVPRVDSRIKIRFLNESQHPDNIQFESVHDHLAAKRWLNGLELMDRNSDIPEPSRYVSEVSSKGDVVHRQSMSGASFPIDSDTHFLSEDWHIKGMRAEVFRRSSALRGRSNFRKHKLRKLVDSIDQSLGMRSTPFRIEFASKKKYQLFAESFERRRIIQKVRRSDVWRRELSEPSGEFGYRLEIESAADLDAVLPVLFWKGLLEKLGDRITVFSNDGDVLRITGALFYDSSK